jgi:predicted nuclease of predicted toxin-antitoxin system
MKLLADQDVYTVTDELLRSNGHDVVTANELGMPRASDESLLNAARSAGRILLTRDRDYGALVHIQLMPGGVIYLRLLLSTMQSVHDELLRVLAEHSDELLMRAFVVVEPARHRMRLTQR